MCKNEQKTFLWRIVSILLAILVLAGGYIHSTSIDRIEDIRIKVEKHEQEIKELEKVHALTELRDNHVEKQLEEIKQLLKDLEAKIDEYR